MTETRTDYASRDQASRAAADMVAAALTADIRRSGRASLMVSGGSTPESMFRLLSEMALDWARVTVGLVDERWVGPQEAESNERLVRRHLLRAHAGAAGFIPMWMPETAHQEAASDRSAAYAPHCEAASFVVLGMGGDGHTASWFPGSRCLARATSAAASVVEAVTAPGAVTPQRLTLSGPAVNRAKGAVLLVFGEGKRAKLSEARTADPAMCPVRFAIDGLGDRLKTVWAP